MPPGPAWAQEGIALSIARETWWREPQWLKEVASSPFDLEAMEHGVPDTLPRHEAALFSAQAAAMVSCAESADADGLAGLLAALGATVAQGELSYRLPEQAEPSNLSTCLAGFVP